MSLWRRGSSATLLPTSQHNLQVVQSHASNDLEWAATDAQTCSFGLLVARRICLAYFWANRRWLKVTVPNQKETATRSKTNRRSSSSWACIHTRLPFSDPRTHFVAAMQLENASRVHMCHTVTCTEDRDCLKTRQPRASGGARQQHGEWVFPPCHHASLCFSETSARIGVSQDQKGQRDNAFPS